MEHRPWPEFSHGKPITKVQLARLLRAFGIVPGTVRRGDLTSKGYRRAQFNDAFASYVPQGDLQSVTPSQPAENQGFPGHAETSQAQKCDGSKIGAARQKAEACDVVTDESPLPWDDAL